MNFLYGNVKSILNNAYLTGIKYTIEILWIEFVFRYL